MRFGPSFVVVASVSGETPRVLAACCVEDAFLVLAECQTAGVLNEVAAFLTGGTAAGDDDSMLLLDEEEDDEEEEEQDDDELPEDRITSP